MKSDICCRPNVRRATSILDWQAGTASSKARLPTASRSMHLRFLRLSLFSFTYPLRAMRPFVFFSILSTAALVAADRTELIDSQDSRILYDGRWKYVSSHVIHRDQNRLTCGPLR